MNGFLSFEGRLGLGTCDETATINDVISTSSMDYSGSIYWRPEWANERAKLYGLLGYSIVSVTNTTGGTDSTNSESGLSYGGGAGFTFYEDWNLNFEYRWILNNDENEFSALGASVDYCF
ncbi:MAG: opacity protein-like surface antigen [Lentisphaeria bacterium]|jgi:opacity protein-like surface antigen